MRGRVDDHDAWEEVTRGRWSGRGVVGGGRSMLGMGVTTIAPESAATMIRSSLGRGGRREDLRTARPSL